MYLERFVISNMFLGYVSKRAYRRAVKWELVQIHKMAAGCIDCGYDKHGVALQFDHRENKKANVSNLIRSDYGWDAIFIEISKCDVRCANCHAIKTKERKNDQALHFSV